MSSSMEDQKPPYDTKSRVETISRDLVMIGHSPSLNVIATSRWLPDKIFPGSWRRTMQGREEGRDPVSAARASQQEAVAGFTRTTLVCADAHKDVETVKGLYNSLIEAKTKCGEPTEDFSFPRFHRLIASKADGLKDSSAVTGCILG